MFLFLKWHLKSITSRIKIHPGDFHHNMQRFVGNYLVSSNKLLNRNSVAYEFKRLNLCVMANSVSTVDPNNLHDDVTKWKHFPRYLPFVRGIHRSPVHFKHKGQWHGALMFYLVCALINDWVNNHEAGESRHHRGHYDVTVIHTNKDNYCFWWHS